MLATLRACRFRLKVGDLAPPFTAEAQDGQTVSLADFRGKTAVVLFFYPGDETLICTKEACAFRDSYEQFVAAGATVIGVSSDSLDSHHRFATNHELPFLLLSDQDSRIRTAFGVPNTLGLFPGRVTYVIDRQGVIQHIFSAQFAASKHVTKALRVVRRLLAGANSEKT